MKEEARGREQDWSIGERTRVGDLRGNYREGVKGRSQMRGIQRGT